MNLTIEIQSDRRWSYANAGTRRPLVKGLRVVQDGALPDVDIPILPRVSLDFPLPELVAEPWTAKVPRMVESRGSQIGATITWDRIDLALNYPLLGRLQDKVRGRIRVDIVNAETDELLATEFQDLELLAPNEFRQEADYLEVIAAFVLPTDPYVSEILQVGRKLLQERTQNSATEGYQADAFPPESGLLEDMRAFQIAHAVYDAMSSMGYDYSNPQGYFEVGAQRVRTPSQIKQENCATCLDSSVLMASCLAQAGLEPVIFMIKGHAFAGYFTGIPVAVGNQVVAGSNAVNHWLRLLRANGLSQLVRSRDYGLIQDLLRHKHILPIETTTTTRGSHESFRDACQSQNGFSVFQDDSLLEGIVIVKLAWLDGITPPVVLQPEGPDAESSWKVDHLLESLPETPQEDEEILDESSMSDAERAIPPRIRQWMASLLDLSSRNPLLKIKPSQMMEFHVPNSIIGTLDDTLYTPKKRIKLPAFSALPYSWVHKGVTDDEFEKWCQKEASLVYPSYTVFNSIQNEVERKLKDIRADQGHPENRYSDADLIRSYRERLLAELDSKLGKTAKKLNDKANEVMLMTGNNSLYLSLGTMAWTETTDFRGQGKTTDWCAPLYLYPVILEGGKGRPWTIRLDPTGEVTPNFCLHEKLKRPPYNIDLQELVNPAEDDKGLDLDKMISSIRRRLKEAKLDNVAVQPRAVLGVFDYATFRLWKDLRDDWSQMAAISPVFKHIAYTSNVPYTGNPPIQEPRLDPLLPIAADDSQRAAVQLALDGQSFKLEGPPGTGKSQTITNLLASCIAHNLKVLFVAEKQTALNQVKIRLDKAGLGTFSLNLHAKGDSDTKLRKNISAALTSALNADIDPAEAKWNEIEFRLSTEQAALDRYRTSLHDRVEGGFSTWDANEQLLEIGEGALLDVPVELVRDFESRWGAVRQASVSLENALDLVPVPGNHLWRFVASIDPATVDFVELTEVLNKLQESVSKLLKTADTTSQNWTHLNFSTLMIIEKGHQLLRDGQLPSLDRLRSMASDEMSSQFDSFQNHCESLVAEAQALRKVLASHVEVVSPSLIDRDDWHEIRDLVNEVESPEFVASLDSVSREWSLVAHHANVLSSSVDFHPIPSPQIPEVQKSLDSAESESDSRDFSLFIVELRKLHSQIQEHQRNISASLISRSDLADIEFRLSEAIDAGFLVKGRKTKVLRETLAADALAKDDKLLVNSASQMVRIAREIRDLEVRLRARFPECSFDGLSLWRAEDAEKCASELLRVRVARLREILVSHSLPADDRACIEIVKVMLKVSPMVEVARDASVKVLPTADRDTLRPWLTDAFETFRSEVIASKYSAALLKIGEDALSTVAARVVESAQVVLAHRDRLFSLNKQLKDELFPEYIGQLRPWNDAELEQVVATTTSVLEFLGTTKREQLRTFVNALNSSADESAIELLASVGSAWSKLGRLIPLGEIDSWLDGRPMLDALATEVPQLLVDAGTNNSYLEFQRWQELRAAVDAISRQGFSSAVPELLDRSVTPTEFLIQVRRSVLTRSLRERMEQGNLDRFDRKVHERRIASFESALKEAQNLLNQRIPGLAASRRQARRLPSGQARGATQDLLRGLNPKRGDKTPIRDLISQYGNALAEAMPCFLMSPDSVASLLPVGAINFDLVVFDEASQIRTSHAVGALGRGKTGIVVGDSRQMPPSSTFSSNTGVFVDSDDESEAQDIQAGGEIDEADEVLVPVAARDAESILNEFEESDLPQQQLLCHYRSKDEVLIAFSNSFIYDEPMLTFPSPSGLQSTALRYVYLSDGVFERDKKAPPYVLGDSNSPVPALRTNLREAEAIVSEVVARLRDPGRQARRAADRDHFAESMIVVTFNVPQMNLITEMLKTVDADLFERATTARPLDDDAETEIPPQLKIRNLENVQGDEAETVIFSVAFSKTPTGKFPLNFGPVTRSGGERRLNVAVTRAQREMIVYASFLPEDMNQGGGVLSPETTLLQSFLKLAHRGVKSTGDVGISVPRSRHIEHVADELRSIGFEVQTQLGLSTLRVDLALRRPGEDRWQIAIIVDDTCWSSRGSAFQRELLPKQVLPAMGWKRIYRIWLPAWKNSKAEIMAELRELLDTNLDVEESKELIGIPAEPPEDLHSQTPQVEPSENERYLATQPSGVTAGSQPQPISAEPIAAPGFKKFVPYSGKGVGGAAVLDNFTTDKTARQAILEVVNAVLIAEAPIEANRLGKSVCRAFGFNRVTPARIEQVLKLVPKSQIKKDPMGRFVWRTEGEWETWTEYRTSLVEPTRTVDEISVVEYQNALIDFLDKAHSLGQEDALREIARTFGFQRLTAPVRSGVERALKEVVKAGTVQLVGGVYRREQKIQ